MSDSPEEPKADDEPKEEGADAPTTEEPGGEGSDGGSEEEKPE